MKKVDLKLNNIERLKKLGKKVTDARLAVLSVLENSKNPLSIKEIQEEIGKKVNKVTLYRIMKDLQSAGLITRTDFHKNRAYFEIKGDEDKHHIICLECSKIREFSDCQFETVSKNILKKISDFKEIRNHSFELFGVCKKCSK